VTNLATDLLTGCMLDKGDFERLEKHPVTDVCRGMNHTAVERDCRSRETEKVAEPIREVGFAWRRGAEA
jgi:hypothetical protein